MNVKVSRIIVMFFISFSWPIFYVKGLEITTASLPVGAAKQEYNTLIQASGGKPPYRWAVPGAIVATGYNSASFDIPAGLTSVVSVIKSDSHQLALKSDGTVVAWGDNSSKQLNIPAGLSNVVAIAAGPYHSLALKSDGRVVVWGGSGRGETNIPAGLTGVIAVEGGLYHSIALKSDGTVVAWGYDAYDALKVPVGLNNVALQ